MAGISKAQARRSRKNEGRYKAQFPKTEKNKERNVKRDSLLKLRPTETLCAYAQAMRARRERSKTKANST